jgi:hypothetical protein
MNHKLSIALLGALSLLAARSHAGDSSAASPNEAQQGFALAGLRAYLFYEPLGQTDDRDLISTPLALWNTATGGGEAKAPSNTVIVQADVTGPAFSPDTKGSASLVATLGTRVLRRETMPLSTFFSAGSKLSIPFVVAGTGCGVLHLRASLSVPGHQQRLEKAIDFPCGE